MAIPPKPAVRSALKGKTVFPLSRHARGDLGHSPPDSRYREAGLLVTCTGATLRLPMRSVFIFRGRAVLGGEGAFRSALRGVCRVEMALDGGVDFRCRDNHRPCWGAADPSDPLASPQFRVLPSHRQDIPSSMLPQKPHSVPRACSSARNTNRIAAARTATDSSK
jgi:hypothetical protein